jgi:hypothetical protein
MTVGYFFMATRRNKRRALLSRPPLVPLNAAIKDYYDHASDEQLEEERLWAEFAGQQFALLDIEWKPNSTSSPDKAYPVAPV